MISENSRRSFLRIIPGSALALLAARFVTADGVPSQNPPPSNKTVPMHGPGMGSGMGNRDITSGNGNPGANGTGPGMGSGQSQTGDGLPPSPSNKPNDGKTNPLAVPRMSLTEAQKDMRQNVAQLAKMAEDLKLEVEKTDSTKVLSLNLVHKSEEIEKLAKHIASLAKG
jgi:hypothetical protein